MINFQNPDKFVDRHIGPDEKDKKEMLDEVGVSSIEELISETIPSQIRTNRELNLDPPLGEYDFIQKLKSIASKNKVYRSYIGMGYYPPVSN
jgi:glycine dehydrogenase